MESDQENLKKKKRHSSYHACMLSCFSHVQLFVIPWTIACQAPLSMGFSRQEYSRWVGCHSLLQGIFLIQVLNPSLLHLLHWQVGSFSTSATWKVRSYHGGGGLVAKLFPTLVAPGTIACQAPLSMGFSTDKNTGVDCHFLLQGIFQTQGSNPGLLHCKKILYRLSYKGYDMTQQFH